MHTYKSYRRKMGRKSKARLEAEKRAEQKLIKWGLITAPIWGVFLLWRAYGNHSENVVFVLPFALLGSWLIFSKFVQQEEQKKKENHQSLRRATDIIQQHRRRLGVLCTHKLRYDSYGMTISNKWDKEVLSFYEKELSHISYNDSTPFKQTALAVVDRIGREERALIKEEQESLQTAAFFPEMSGMDFEHYCASLMSSIGWEAFVTKGSGDQGADVVATKNGQKIIIQCKLYNKPVGNSAVQQVYGAIAHYFADKGIVVGNSGFTASAFSLASTTGISLLDHRELIQWVEANY